MIEIDRSAINISIIEDSHIHAEWLKAIISDFSTIRIVSFDDNGKNGLLSIKTHHPELVLLDFQLKDITGMEVSKRIKLFNNNIKIFILTAHTEISIIERLIADKNIDAIGIKGSPYFEENFLPAIFQICKGGTYLDPSLLGKLRESMVLKGLSSLTKREFEIFIQINIGKDDFKIAHDLNIEVSHVRNMKSKIVKKIKDDNVDSLITKLIENA